MCTVTWATDGKIYDLFMNRDEFHTRGRAIPATVASTAGVAHLAPKDTDGGGSWIAVNEFGITICLLNNYTQSAISGRSGSNGHSNDGAAPGVNGTPGVADRQFTGRGILTLSLMDARSIDEVGEKLQTTQLDQYRPFYVFAVGGPTVITRLFRWDGEGRLHINIAPEPPIGNSSSGAHDIVRIRKELYQAKFGSTPVPVTPEALSALHAYHRTHEPERGSNSVCAHREDGGTKSLSHVQVRSDNITFTYTDGPPCENGAVTVANLHRTEA